MVGPSQKMLVIRGRWFFLEGLETNTLKKKPHSLLGGGVWSA
jgi:hypothetical protein